MNPARLLQHFERIAEAPDAIPRLRRFILDLAVRGKLVEQDPSDEPVSSKLALNDHARKETAQKDRRADSGLQQLLVPEEKWEVPSSWEWRAIADLVLFIDYRGKTPSKVEEGIRLITAKNVRKGFISLLPEEFLSESNYEKWMTRGIPQEGDVLFTTEAPMGNAAVVRLKERFALAQRVINFRSYGALDPDFLVLQLLAEPFQSILNKTATGLTAKGIKAAKLKRLPIAIPPLAEQHRIVAKVDELMALCDQLKAAKTEREQSCDRLVAASLHRLNSPVDAEEANTPEAFCDHARFYFNHLPRLTARAEHIKQLRQTILNLAVRGKLVPQDPNDEPAAELLKRIQKHKVEFAKSDRAERSSAMEILNHDEVPFMIPSGWVWVSFGSIMISRDGERIPVSKEERVGRAKVYDYYGASGVIDKIDNYLFDKSLLLVGEDGANLINRSTPIAFIAHGKYWVNNHAHVLDGISEGFLRYIELHINAINLKPYVTGTAQPKMNQAKMNSIPIALPPLAEQHRIVAKVDELMALCDQLEAQLISTEADSRSLLEAVLHEALAPALGVTSGKAHAIG